MYKGLYTFLNNSNIYNLQFGIQGVSNDWFKSYLSNCSQYVSINGYESGLAALNCGVP